MEYLLMGLLGGFGLVIGIFCAILVLGAIAQLLE